MCANCAFVADTKLPTPFGCFRMRAYRTKQKTEPVVIYKPSINKLFYSEDITNVRVHSQCITSEVFSSLRCDCKEQFNASMEYINVNGGAIIYLQQEGRGIGLANKIKAYELQDNGADTIDANIALGFDEDLRNYEVVPFILQDMGISNINLITNNPDKTKSLQQAGVNVIDTIRLNTTINEHNYKYIQTKIERMGHLIHL